MKDIEYNDTITEWCPECETEVELANEFKVQRCPNCGKWILPCNYCDHDTCDCTNCPLESKVIELRKEQTHIIHDAINNKFGWYEVDTESDDTEISVYSKEDEDCRIDFECEFDENGVPYIKDARLYCKEYEDGILLDECERKHAMFFIQEDEVLDAYEKAFQRWCDVYGA